MKKTLMLALAALTSGSLALSAESFTGKVNVSNRMRPELTANGQTYYLRMPHRVLLGAGVKDGDNITVDGDVETYSGNGETRTWVRVNSLNANGQTIDLSTFSNGGYGRMMSGEGRGMRGGFGGGSCCL